LWLIYGQIWEDGWGRNSPDPIFFFRVFWAWLLRGWSRLRPGRGASEVKDLRRLSVQPAWPIISISESFTSQSEAPTPNLQRKEGVRGIPFPACLLVFGLNADRT
jgi:hypothetical protein